MWFRVLKIGEYKNVLKTLDLSRLLKSFINCSRPRTFQIFFSFLRATLSIFSHIFFVFIFLVNIFYFFCYNSSSFSSFFEISQRLHKYFIRDHKKLETCTIRNLNNTESCLFKAQKKTNKLTKWTLLSHSLVAHAFHIVWAKKRERSFAFWALTIFSSLQNLFTKIFSIHCSLILFNLN